ncbi:metal-dependent hydrolase [Ornithinimicrobium murale]|uniref:metal-dependent hydrolase n=1 Tax=Ornithinimicrobium murale TaxID=1050153 RepID=UPI0013B3FCA3|nr:metal-dependent hydrolase [Ornithinimicrobium murale]
MGRTHVLMTGALATLAAQPLANIFLDRNMSAGEVVAFGAVTAGYGLLPDLDHPQATLGRVLGPVTKAIATVTATVSGGHRKGTHTIWAAILAVLGVTWVVSQDFAAHPEAIFIFISLFLVAMILRLGPKPRSGPAELTYAAIAAAGTAAIVYFVPVGGDGLWWLPFAVGAGIIGHVLGDILTTEGVPVLYPLFPKLVVKFPILGSTDSAREHGFAWVCTVAWMGGAWFALSGAGLL